MPRGDDLFNQVAAQTGDQLFEDAASEPNKAERFLGEFVSDKPTLQAILANVVRPGSAVINTLEAGVNVIKGEGGEALESIKRAGRNVVDFAGQGLDAILPGDVIPEIGTPRDFRTGSQLLETAGVDQLGELDVPLIGKVSGRGALGLVVDIATDPLRFVRVGQPTKAALIKRREALTAADDTLKAIREGKGGAPTLTPGQIVKALDRDNFGKVVSVGDDSSRVYFRNPDTGAEATINLPNAQLRPLGPGASLDPATGQPVFQGLTSAAEEARQGLRPLVSLRAPFSEKMVPLVGPRVSGTVIDAFESGRDWLIRNTPLRRVVQFGGNAGVGRLAARAAGKGIALQQDFVQRAGAIWNDALERGLKAGMTEDEAWRAFLLGVEKKPTGAAARAAVKASGPDKVREAIRRQSLEFLEAVDDKGIPLLTEREALRAAQASTLLGVDPIMAPHAARFTTEMKDLLRTQQELGLGVLAVTDPGLDYIRRELTDQGRNFLKNNPKLQRRIEQRVGRWYADASVAKKRAVYWQGKPIPDINDFMAKEMKKQGFTGTLFEENPLRIVEALGRRLGKTARSSDLMETVTRTFGKQIGNDTPTDWVPFEQILRKANLETDIAGAPTRFAKFKGMALPPEIADAMTNVVRMFRDSDVPSGLMKVLDTSTTFFRELVTTPFPAFHFRNFVSNIWANFMGDVKGIRPYKLATEIMADVKWRGGSKVFEFANGVKMTSAQILEQMDAFGALGFGFFTGRHARSKLIRNTPVIGHYVKGMGRFGEGVENYAKIAHFVDKLNKGLPIDEAAFSVKKYLFNYSELTAFEKRVMRRIVPFYTWARKNIPLQLETLLTKPGKAATAGHIQAAMRAREEDGRFIDTTITPDWIHRRMIGTAKNDDGSISQLSGFGIGLEDLSIFDRPFDDFIGMLNPLLKAPIQQATGKDFFRDIPLDRAEVAPSVLRFAPKAFKDAIDFRAVPEPTGETRFYRANPRFLNWLRGAPFASGLSRAVNISTTIERSLEGQPRPGAPNTPVRLITGLRAATKTPRLQELENTRLLMDQWTEELETLVREGKAFEVSERFGIRRDLLPDDPARQRVRTLNRDLMRARRAARALSRTAKAEERKAGRSSLNQ